MKFELRTALMCLFAIWTWTDAKAQIVPYFGKNKVKYDTFDWQTYRSKHFEIYFYPEEKQHLARVATMAESSYEAISNDLKHTIEFKIPLIFFKTSSEFEQVNYLHITEGVLGAAEPFYNRMAFSIDQPDHELRDLITHELTHVFEFSLLYGGSVSQLLAADLPLWIMEGYAEYQTHRWDPSDLMVVRDAVLTECLPFISVKEGFILPEKESEPVRAPYNIGHAAFEFMEKTYGKESISNFWFQLKKAKLLGRDDVMQQAFGVNEEAFNEKFAEYLRGRFNEYQDKQSPQDYASEIKLPEQYKQIFSQAPSPDAKEFVILTANYRDYELDLLKIDQKGQILGNLTGGYTTRYDYLTTDSFRFEGRNISWNHNGERVFYMARSGKRRSLFVIDSQNGSVIKEYPLDVDQAGSPSPSFDGRTVAFSGLRNGQADLFLIDLKTGEIRQVTSNSDHEKTPAWSQDGKWIFFTSYQGEYAQIFRIRPGVPESMEQITFFEHNSLSPHYDAASDSIFYSADKGGPFNIYRLHLATGDSYQYTDVIGGNFSPSVFYEDQKPIIAFTSFFKGRYRLFIMDLPSPIAVFKRELTALAKSNIAETGTTGSMAVIDERKIQDKKLRWILRPNSNGIATGVSQNTFAVSSGIVLEDILGDQEFRFSTTRVNGFQSYNAGYLDLRHRFQYLVDLSFTDDYFYTSVPGELAAQTGYSIDIVRSRLYGPRFISQYPFNRFYRMELGAGILRVDQDFYDPVSQDAYEEYLQGSAGSLDFLVSGGYLPLVVAFVGETSRFREFGPIAGHTFRLSIEHSPGFSDSWVSRTIYEADFRKYFRLSGRSLIAARARGFVSNGSDPVIFSHGGGQDVRGFDFREISGTQGAIGNFEFRFPLFPNPRIPFLGQLRGKIFADFFRISYGEYDLSSTATRFVGGLPFVMDLGKGAGSLGVGFTVFAGGIPLNFDFSKVFGKGQLTEVDFILNPDAPFITEFTDGLEFDFSIGYDF